MMFLALSEGKELGCGQVDWLTVAIDTAGENRLYPNAQNGRGTDDHVFPLNVFNRNLDKIGGNGLGLNFGGIPLLKVLQGWEADFFTMSTFNE